MTGKLSSKELNEYVLNHLKSRRKEVKLAAAVGEDCAVIEAKDLLLVTSDPITGANSNIGKLAIYVSSNDISASGGESIAAFLTIIVPEKTELSSIRQIITEAETAAAELNIQIAGGHTEYSDAVIRPIVNCTMIGKPLSQKVFSGANIKIGDSILMTATVAREYTAIMVADKPETIGLLTPKELAEVREYINVSIAKPARVCAFLPISAMHDATEGGIVGAIEEIMLRANAACKLTVKNIPISSATKKICKFFNTDPLKQLSSGSLLIATRFPKEVARELKRSDIDACKIGEVVEGGGILYA